MIVTVFRYLILIIMTSTILFLCFLLSFIIDCEDMSNTRDSVSSAIKVHLKRSATCRIFDSLPAVLKCGQTRSFVFDLVLIHKDKKVIGNTVLLQTPKSLLP